MVQRFNQWLSELNRKKLAILSGCAYSGGIRIKCFLEENTMEQNIIGTTIAALRREKGLTQDALAAQLGVSAQAVSKWENGDSLR